MSACDYWNYEIGMKKMMAEIGGEERNVFSCSKCLRRSEGTGRRHEGKGMKDMRYYRRDGYVGFGMRMQP